MLLVTTFYHRIRNLNYDNSNNLTQCVINKKRGGEADVLGVLVGDLEGGGGDRCGQNILYRHMRFSSNLKESENLLAPPPGVGIMPHRKYQTPCLCL